MKVGYYSTANIGRGHLQRKLAIERHVTLSEPSEDCDVVLIDIDWPSYVANQLHIKFPVPTWLILRYMPTNWLARAFAERRPARVFTIEDFPGSEAFERLNPIVRWRPDERLTREYAREQLGLDPSAHVGAVIHSGPDDEVTQLHHSLVDNYHVDEVRYFTDSLNAYLWANAFDAIATGAGYNCFHEFGRNAATVAFDRGNGEQEWRLRAGKLSQINNGAEQLANEIRKAFT